MSTHVQQHYVPKFLLEEWRSGPDRKLTAYRWRAGRLVESRCSPKGVAKVEHLYSLRRTDESPDVRLERDYFGPKLDSLAAPIHRRLVAGELEALSDEERVDWGRFILAQMVRVPVMVEFMRTLGRKTQIEQLQHMAVNAGHPAAAKIWERMERAHVVDDVGIKVLPQFIESPKLNRKLYDASWGVIELDDGPIDALLSDSPVGYLGDLADSRFVFILPLTPSRLFVCASGQEDLSRIQAGNAARFVKATNRKLVQQAQGYVFSTNANHTPLVSKHLRQGAR